MILQKIQKNQNKLGNYQCMKNVIEEIRTFYRKATQDSLTAYAAQATFYVLLSFFPFIILLIRIASRLSFTRTTLVSYILGVVPDELNDFVMYIMRDILYSESNSFTVITALVCIWSAGRGLQTLTYGFNKIYKVEKNKGYLITRLMSILYTIIFLLMCIAIMIIYLFGKQIAEAIINKWPAFDNATTLILSMKGLFSFTILFVLLLIFYYQLPGRKGQFKHELWGALAASVAWILMTRLFSFYIRYMAKDSYMYGSMTSVILIIIWIYIGMQIIFYGAEINYYVTKRKLANFVDTKK